MHGMTQELVTIFILCFMVIGLVFILGRKYNRDGNFRDRIRAMDIDRQRLVMDFRDSSQKIALLESKVDYLLRIQQAKENIKNGCSADGKLLRKMDLDV